MGSTSTRGRRSPSPPQAAGRRKAEGCRAGPVQQSAAGTTTRVEAGLAVGIGCASKARGERRLSAGLSGKRRGSPVGGRRNASGAGAGAGAGGSCGASFKRERTGDGDFGSGVIGPQDPFPGDVGGNCDYGDANVAAAVAARCRSSSDARATVSRGKFVEISSAGTMREMYPLDVVCGQARPSPKRGRSSLGHRKHRRQQGAGNPRRTDYDGAGSTELGQDELS